MKLLRVGPAGSERPAVLHEGVLRDASSVVDDIDGATLSNGGLDRLRTVLSDNPAGLPELPTDGVRIGAPIARPHQILCIGLNYADHAAESGMDIPAEPIVFNKAPNTLVGPNDDVHIPPGSEKTDWEVELGVVIGHRARYLPDEDAARQVIAGYVVVNDVSERAYQLERGGQWVKGKSCETFNPAGPWLVTADEIPDIQQLTLHLDLNDQRVQSGTTATMIFSVATLVHYLSQFMVLEPGDLINTGTPPGVGLGMSPPRYLEAGDIMELGIEGLGTQRQRCVPAPD
jgi:2,4-didehydro-3-deoxy-L-rhamnonate hydrolase